MMQTIGLTPVQTVTITILADGVFDGMLPDQGVAKRPALGPLTPLIPTVIMEQGQTFAPLLAQGGFGALITLTQNGRTHNILFDMGVTPNGIVDTMSLFDLSLKNIEAVVLSHGHADHTTGLDGLARTLGRANLPLLLHPEFWNRRRFVIPGRDPFEIPTTSKSALQGVGFDVIEEREPSFLLDGSLLITGEVDRTNNYERGMAGQQALRGDTWLPDSLTLDDQAVIINVQDKGLVVLTGCGHSGIVNIVRYAQKLTGIDKIYAILGGFHLVGGPEFEQQVLSQVCNALADFAPQVIVPAHCTGFRAVQRLATHMPDAFIPSSVGTRFEL